MKILYLDPNILNGYIIHTLALIDGIFQDYKFAEVRKEINKRFVKDPCWHENMGARLVHALKIKDK